MEYVYGALLLHKLGQPVSEENLKKVITAAGSSVDEAKVKVLAASLKDIDIGKELESATLAVAAGPSASAGTEKKEEKKEEKAAEAAEGLSALFG
ncbi:50S ribosomal protein P1 [Candidatus Pacearchaeota archaeon]|nr:50S ribosomal protein P1 [Candidatus Pacearchaeota archaeon]